MSATHPSDTVEYWLALARDERDFAQAYHQTVESVRVHLNNALEYEARAAAIAAKVSA